MESKPADDLTQPPGSQSEATAAPAVDASPVVGEPPIPPVPRQTFLRGLYANLRSGFRIAILRRVQPSDLVTGLGQVVALFLIAAGVALLLDWLSAVADAQFDYSGFYSWAICIVMTLWACALATRSLSAGADTRTLIIAIVSVAPWLFLVIAVLARVPLPESDPFFGLVVAFFVFLFAVRAIRAAYGFLRFSTIAVVLAAAVIAGLGTYNGYIYARLWQAPYEESSDEDESDSSATESTLFDQPARIAEAVEKVEPGKPGVINTFFVGFAGDGSQQIFRREVLFGESVFADRMASGHRSLELINDESDRLSHPLGTMTGLSYALKLVASRMNADEDVLVLFLTSHGSQDEGLYVRNGNLPLNSIEPEEVRRALDISGIKWRVVIVSACYSGAFIDALKSDTTLVITAADADHTSFGCADDRDLTYFGEAFLKDALPKAASLEEAFVAARDDIAQREKAEKLTPSNPQMFVGEAMARKLMELGPLPVSATLPTSSTK